ncbi:MAG: xanthine dehydrogenase accessory protein XdhC [Flavobacteriaceae bacterium]
MKSLSDWLSARLARGIPVALIEIVEAAGSTPRDAGATMLADGDSIAGTIGGGRVEWLAVEAARTLLAGGEADGEIDVALGPQTSQCCGGRVRIRLSRADSDLAQRLAESERCAGAARDPVYVFGAGNVGLALCRALALLPVRVTLADTRPGMVEAAMADLGESTDVVLAREPERLVALAPAGAAFVVTTHDHALDFAITEAALSRPDAAYVGLIGSATKKARFASYFRGEGGAEETLSRLVCPIGGAAVDDKRPEVIAAMTAAELLTFIGASRNLAKNGGNVPAGARQRGGRSPG